MSHNSLKELLLGDIARDLAADTSFERVIHYVRTMERPSPELLCAIPEEMWEKCERDGAFGRADFQEWCEDPELEPAIPQMIDHAPYGLVSSFWHVYSPPSDKIITALFNKWLQEATAGTIATHYIHDPVKAGASLLVHNASTLKAAFKISLATLRKVEPGVLGVLALLWPKELPLLKTVLKELWPTLSPTERVPLFALLPYDQDIAKTWLAEVRRARAVRRDPLSLFNPEVTSALVGIYTTHPTLQNEVEQIFESFLEKPKKNFDTTDFAFELMHSFVVARDEALPLYKHLSQLLEKASTRPDPIPLDLFSCVSSKLVTEFVRTTTLSSRDLMDLEARFSRFGVDPELLVAILAHAPDRAPWLKWVPSQGKSSTPLTP